MSIEKEHYYYGEETEEEFASIIIVIDGVPKDIIIYDNELPTPQWVKTKVTLSHRKYYSTTHRTKLTEEEAHTMLFIEAL